MGLFKQPEYRRFNFQPRYWDPELEARKEREARIRAELGLDKNKDEYIPDVRTRLQQEYAKRRIARKEQRATSQTFRLFLVLIILLVLAFYFITYKMDAFLKLF